MLIYGKIDYCKPRFSVMVVMVVVAVVVVMAVVVILVVVGTAKNGYSLYGVFQLCCQTFPL
jgi:hypothetical protein